MTLPHTVVANDLPSTCCHRSLKRFSFRSDRNASGILLARSDGMKLGSWGGVTSSSPFRTASVDGGSTTVVSMTAVSAAASRIMLITTLISFLLIS